MRPPIQITDVDILYWRLMYQDVAPTHWRDFIELRSVLNSEMLCQIRGHSHVTTFKFLRNHFHSRTWVRNSSSHVPKVYHNGLSALNIICANTASLVRIKNFVLIFCLALRRPLDIVANVYRLCHWTNERNSRLTYAYLMSWYLPYWVEPFPLLSTHLTFASGHFPSSCGICCQFSTFYFLISAQNTSRKLCSSRSTNI